MGLCIKFNDNNQLQLFLFKESWIPLTMSISFSPRNPWVLSMITMVGPFFNENCTTILIKKNQKNKEDKHDMSTRKSTNLPKLINRPYLFLNSRYQLTDYTMHTDLDSEWGLGSKNSPGTIFIFICLGIARIDSIIHLKQKTTMKRVKIVSSLCQNCLFYEIGAWCEFVFVTLHRTPLNCDVIEMVNIKKITFSK